MHVAQIFEHGISDWDSYSYALEGPVQPGACHGTTLEVTADAPYPLLDKEATFTRATKCADPPTGGDEGGGDGVVDSGMELFGNAIHDNGFEKLKIFDGDGDSVVDAADAIWSSLRLWIDSNHNGISEAGEISSMASSRFTAVGVAFQIVGNRDRYGNQYRYKGRVYTQGDQKGKERVYDIIFAEM